MNPITPDSWKAVWAMIILIVVALLMTVGLASLVRAEPPLGADMSLAPWFNSLTDRHGVSCCSVADCRPTEWRVGRNDQDEPVLQAKIGPADWAEVPPDKVLSRYDNPTGRPVVCWSPARGVMCFVRAAES